MSKDLTWGKAIEKVLSNAASSMHYRDITDAIIEQKLRSNLGATPAATVSAHLTTILKNEPHKSLWQKVGKGLYIWTANTKDLEANVLVSDIKSSDEDEEQYDVVSSFGMFWRREEVEWTGNPKILGKQRIGAKIVDFSKQIGIYLLYDGREIIYVGRSTERPLGRRLYEHTVDRLSSRWDRFSWFGVLPVNETGELGSQSDSFSAHKLLPALEAILIEALEPRQNRKRGDDLASVEYIQEADPSIKKKIVKQAMEAALDRL